MGKIYYVDVEALNLTYWNPKYYRDCNATAKRFGRNDPIHYIHIHGETLVPLGNNVLVDVFVHEFLSNEYRRSFVEMHYKLCDLLLRDNVFGQYINKDLPKTCPIPKGVYHLTNMSIPDLPLLKTFPFQKGRVFAHTTIKREAGTRERLLDGYVDVVIKQRWR
ncbi:uncharacterized protein [Choristoneura fumiferana]|uniref:uncharacterized protein n=1 Tax=Choristoneura fumiferana TaxID=7141 RepID=UPI003D15393F